MTKIQIIVLQAAFGAMVGAYLVPAGINEWRELQAAREQAAYATMPVVKSAGRIIAQTLNDVTILIEGTKLLACRPEGLHAFTYNASGASYVAALERMAPFQGPLANRALGPFVSGPWRVYPIQPGAVEAQIHMMYDCNGVARREVLARVRFHVGT